METPTTIRVGVIMRRRALADRWHTVAWEPVGVVMGSEAGNARPIVDSEAETQWLYPGMPVTLRRSEGEGYYLNVSSREPRAFVLWREEGELAVPHFVTLSYEEASRWMDGGENVDSVPLPPELFAWVGEFVEKHYRPEPKKRIKPRSFVHPRDREGRQ
jgi:hypothetical protein